VKEFISQLTEGQTIFVHWAAGTDAGKWFGRVTRAGTQSIRVAFDVRLCDSCMAPRQASKPLAGVVPTPGMMYYAIERKQVPRVEPCVCADVPDPDDDAEMDGDDQPHADDFPNDFAVSAQIDRTVNASPEGQPLGELVHVPPGAPTADVSAGWYIPHGRPDWVHVLVWKQLAESTRLNHQRWLRTIKGMPADLRRGRSISHAVVEMVIRMASARKWVWSTVASALAACNAALASLPIYTNEQYSIKVGTDPYFQQASRMAQQKARATASLESLTAGLSQQQFEHLTSSDGIKSHRVRLLLQMMWYWASRPKEMREVRPCDIVIKQARPDGCSHVSITFHTGKVVPYCGPYTIHVILPKRVTCAVRAAVESVSPDAALFTTRDQAILAGVIGGLQGHGDGLPRLNLRSIRRGSVLHLAASGVRDVELQLLTGHKRMDTLMRYLGWGRESATMREAAAARQQADAIRGAGADSPILPTQHQPPKMGPHSGYVGNKGRRVLPPPKFFPRKMPSAEDCGVSRDHIDTSDYTLHIKETSRVDWTAVSEMADRTPLQPEVLLANRWCTSPAFYGPRIVIEPRKIPATTCDPAQLEQLLRADKIRPHHGPINGFVNMFTIAQHNKKRLRVIAEPVINATCDREHIYKVKYPSRLERRARARGAKFEAELDFAAYFDQFELSPDVLSWFVVRSRHPIDGATLFTLTRLPMGVTFAPSVAQAVTSALVYPLLHMEGVTVDTCIDNIRVIAREPQQFVHAMRTLLGRIHTAKITLNDAHTWDVPDGELLQRCAVTEAPRIFLGEQYTGDTISNTPAAVDKLKAALVRFDEGCTNAPYTKRNFASLVGLMLFMTHTIGVDLARFHTLLRAYGRIIAETAGWDEPCLITSDAVRDQLKAMGEEILLNPRVPLPILEPPSRVIEHYDAAIEVDASGSAWGAIVRITATGDTFTLQQRWSVSMLHSARAEPTAALRAVQWIRAHLGRNASVAIITDHIAMASGQRRWNSAYGGFSSTGYHLNEFYRELYSNGGGQVFYVEGEDNRADGISRDPTAPFHLKVEKADLTFRDLGLVTHPFEVLPRKQYQV
jgi:ribonuclease HI